MYDQIISSKKLFPLDAKKGGDIVQVDPNIRNFISFLLQLASLKISYINVFKQEHCCFTRTLFFIVHLFMDPKEPKKLPSHLFVKPTQANCWSLGCLNKLFMSFVKLLWLAERLNASWESHMVKGLVTLSHKSHYTKHKVKDIDVEKQMLLNEHQLYPCD